MDSSKEALRAKTLASLLVCLIRTSHALICIRHHCHQHPDHTGNSGSGDGASITKLIPGSISMCRAAKFVKRQTEPKPCMLKGYASSRCRKHGARKRVIWGSSSRGKVKMGPLQCQMPLRAVIHAWCVRACVRVCAPIKLCG